MATMEKLFAQIFERKNRIVEQVRQQTLLFDQHLASKCLLDGIVPPPWLWSSDPTELNKEELISELLLPCPPSAIPYSRTYCPLYKKPFVDKGDLPDGFYTEVRNSHKALDAGDRLSISPQLPINDAGGPSGGVEKPDSSSASSPQEQREARIPNITPEPAQSLASFQRSKSRQRALELRSSAKAVRSQLGVDNNTGLFASGNRGSEIASPRQDHVHELELVESVHNNNERCEVEEVNVDDFLSKDKESRKEELVSSPLLPVLQSAASCSSRDLVPYDKPAVLSENEELPDGFHTEVHAWSKGFVAADGQSDLLQLPVHDAGCGSSIVPELEFGATSPQDQRNARVSDINPEPFQSLARVQRSKSRQRALELRDSAKAAKSHLYVENDICTYSSVDNRSVIVTPQSGQVHGSELVKPANVYGESYEAEEVKVCVSKSKEKGSTHYSGRITRSLSSRQQPSSLRLPSRLGNPTSVGRSSRGGNNVDCVELSGELIEEIPSCLRSFGSVEVGSCPQKVGRQITDAVSASPSLKEGDAVQSNVGGSPIDKLNHVDQSMTEGSKPSPVRISHPLSELVDELETVKPVDGNYESCVVEEAKVGDVHSREKGSNLYSNRIMRSRSSEASPVNEKNHEEQPLTGGSESSPIMISSPVAEHDGLKSVKPVDIYSGSCVVGEAKVGDLQSRGNGNKIYSGRITRSLSSKVTSIWITSPVDKMDPVDQPMSEGSKSSPVRISSPLLEHFDELESVEALDTFSGSCVVEEVRDVQEDSSNLYSGRITRSQSSKSSPVRIRSSIDKTDHVEQPMTEVRDVQEDSSNLYSGRITRSQSSKSSPVRIRSSIDKTDHVEQPMTEVRDVQEDSSNLYSGRITRSRSFKSSPVRIRSSIDKTDHVEQPITEGSKLSPVRIKCSIDKMDRVEQPMTDGSKLFPVGISSPQLEHVKELELVKPVDICYENCIVEEANVGDLQGREEGNNFYSGRVTRLRSSNQQASSMMELLNVDNSSGTGSRSDEKNVSSSNSGQQIRKHLILSGKELCCGEDGSPPQLKRRRIGSQLNDSLSVSPNMGGEAVAQSNLVGSPVVANDLNEGCHIIEGSQSSPKLLVDKGELSLEERKRSAFSPFTFSHEESDMHLIPSLVNQATGDSKVCLDLETGVADPTSFIHDSRGQGPQQENEVLLHLDGKFEQGSTEHLTTTETVLQEGTSHPEENDKISYCLTGSPRRQSMELICADQAVPEFEGFIMQTDGEQSHIAREDIRVKLSLPKTTIERASLLEQLCKSACMHTPLSPFSTTYKLHGLSNLYQSVPNGLLECIDMKNSIEVNDDIGKQLKASYSYFKEEVNQALQERSHSDCLPLPNAQSAWDIKKPFTSPVGKLWDKVISNPGSSEKRGSLNAELPCISEENESTEGLVEVLEEGISKDVMQTSVKREPLADITEKENLPETASEAEIFAARNSLESVNTEYSFIGTCYGVNQKLGHNNSSKKGLTNKAKVSTSVSIGEYGTKRMRESVQGRFSKPKLSGKPSLRKEGPSLGGREAKRNNIVSNVSSFVPLVQQKQAAAIITGKRDVKVKALEAAEAAKRLAQEKENEKKVKKEALKLERARLEQENLKQMELQKKKKEEERKKKEADMAARKRQREEEERKDKERKRKRLMETWKQHRDNEEKLRARKDKELKCQPVDERTKDMKTSRHEAGKDDKKEKETGVENLGKLSKTEPKTTMVSTSDSIKSSTVLEACEASMDCGYNSKVKSNLEKATVENIFTRTNEEESYDISPYKESDDEDEDDDDMPNSKFIPSWASKTCLARAVSSQQNINPELVFTPESFCSVTEVLLPRRLQQK